MGHTNKLSKSARQSILALARFESGYGRKWSKLIRNWGAVHCANAGASGVCPSGCVGYTDHHGNGKPYMACFVVYEDDVDGAMGMMKIWFGYRGFAEAADRGDMAEIARIGHAHHYFELDPEEYAERISSCRSDVAKTLKPTVHPKTARLSASLN
jgi:hypothetical protein